MLFGSIVSLWTVLGVGAGAFAVIGLPILAIVVGVMLYRRTAGQQPGMVVTVPGLNKQVDLGIFSGLVAAARSGDRNAVLQQVQLLAIRAGDAGGIEALIEKFIYDTLEKKLATHERTAVFTLLADLLGVDERQLLDLVEAKTPPATSSTAPPATSGGSSPVIPVATPLIALALFVLAAGEASAAPPLVAPQRFYAAEVEPVIDPPKFHRMQAGALQPQGDDLVAPSGWQPAAHYPTSSGRRWYSSGRGRAPLRWLFRCR